MGRLKITGVAVRHQLPFTAVSNFIDCFARLVDERKTSCCGMLAREDLILPTHADMYCSDQIGRAADYGVRVENSLRGEYEVYIKLDQKKRRAVVFQPSAGIFGCSCMEDRLRGLPCRHLISVLSYLTDRNLLNAAHFTTVFGALIAPFFKKCVYMRGTYLYVNTYYTAI
ncbi:hypothetical protein B484DRAFT_470269, partial [Ochromonadaceae sp. CCMP2298]